MSDDDVELVRSGLEAFNRRDLPRVFETLDPDVELVPVRAVLEGNSYRGHGGFERFVADMDEDWDNFRPEPEEVRDLGGGSVLVVGRFSARGKASGVEVSTPAVWLCDVRDGKVARVSFYADEAAALDAVAAR
jgi:ketosteroid isomerase-like protein